MEFIFPHRMGYLPTPIAELENRESWCDLMVEFSLPFSAASLNKIKLDPRANQLSAFRISSRSINQLSDHALCFTNLDTIFLEDEGLDFLNKENDPGVLLNAYPGLSKLYMKKGFENPGIPLRHVGLDYLGLPYTPAKKRLGDLICPNLSILAIDMEGINFLDSPVLACELIEELVSVVQGDLFPSLQRLYISNCEFINRLASEVFTGASSLKQLDVMKSYEIGSNGVKKATDLAVLLAFAEDQRIHLTTDERVATVPDLVKANTVLLPY